jgi:23S rRNA pseudouridine2605 synthase
MKHAFDKFINQERNSKKKENIKQEKRKWKEDRKKKFEERNKISDAPAKKFNRTEAKPSGKNFELKKHDQHSKFKNINQAPAINTRQAVSEMPLNKFIAHAGVCGRREAAELVKGGKVKVNNAIIYEPGFKVSENDKVVFNGKQLYPQKNLVYILLNKPKDYITTAKDTHGRKTVLELIEGATQERVFSVGRLDRNTTGVLLLTNDGELTQKLTHPSFEVKKIYEAKLDKPLLKKDMEAILSGIQLEDGFIAADTIGYADTKDKSLIGIEIHSGRNRIVRRIFEHLGYDVKGLDRVLFANLTKKNVDRGKWRFLKEKEVRLLKYMNQSFMKKAEPGLEKTKRSKD